MKKYSIGLIFLFTSCLNPDCETLSKEARNRECLLIVEELPSLYSYKLEAKGKHLVTKKDCICSDADRWWVQYKDYLDKGDTIIKKKGELVFYIHKKDTILSFNWECDGKIFKS